MVKDVYSYSNCAQYFIHSGPDGKLKLWETTAGVLKQEYVPNLHLNSPCTSIIWISLPSGVALGKGKKRKLDGKAVKLVVIGTGNGTIAIYSLSEGKVISTLEGGHSTPINALAWSADEGLFSVAENLIVNWDLANSTIKSKWKCGKNKPTGLAVTAKGDLCLTGSYELNLWDVQKQSLLKTFTGHSSEVTHIQFINPQYFISAASNDRHISVWSINSDSADPIGRFALSDTLNSDISITENMGSLYLGAATQSGSLHYFSHQLNGKVSKSIKPKQTVEIATERENSKVSPLPIVAVKLKGPISAHIVYGYSPQFSFETIKITEGKENRVCLIRSENSKPVVHNNSVKNGAEVTENVEYLSASSAIKRKSGKNEIPMEDRLGNLSIDYKEPPGSNKQSPYNMSQLLIQTAGNCSCHVAWRPQATLVAQRDASLRYLIPSLPVALATSKIWPSVEEEMNYVMITSLVALLGAGSSQGEVRGKCCASSASDVRRILERGLESKDKTMLDSVLMRRDQNVIQETISRLPIQVLTPLLQELKTKLQGKTLCCVLGSLWLKAVMRTHASQLIADSTACELLASIQSHIDMRMNLLGPLCNVQGRVGQILSQIEAPLSNSLSNMEPVVLYQDEDSDVESLINSGIDGDDYEDRWDELSDQEIDSGDDS